MSRKHDETWKPEIEEEPGGPAKCRLVVHVEPRVVRDPPDVRLERVGGEEMELEVLGPAADGVGHLLTHCRTSHGCK